MFSLATTYNELNTDNPTAATGPIGALLAGVQAVARPSASVPETPVAGPAASVASAAGAVEQAALAQAHLAAQQQAAEHLAALKDAAHGGGLRVQIVGSQPPQW